ncbi:hypothetical protein EJ08DRAFT_672152 [Tothia fuscella]|uniref:Mechanosensitive ion channel protein n=1 Tax=Tothia fuscella TaxID=1048955 RepID=A0A9P4NK28_9PEZI|nr:hypothetical protein EJ08DRAFT_672152 [Tothia fuscella]
MDGTLTRMGRIYAKIVNFSVVTRYFLYVLPLALVLAVPIIVGATAARKAQIGGIRIVWLFTWIEIVWLSLWVSKLFARSLPRVFKFVVGVVSSGVRKYALVIRALEIPLSLVGWALVSLLTFTPLMLRNPDTPSGAALKPWMTIIRQVLGALLVCFLIFFGERLIVQLISINYHGKQFDAKIKENKHMVYLLSLLYDASTAQFPEYCETFAHEDYVINDALNLSGFSKKGSGKGSGSATPMKFLHNVGRFGDGVTSVFGKVAQEITGKQVNIGSSHAVVTQALEKNRACEALAKRLWMSFVMEGNETLFKDDIIEVLGPSRSEQAEECFASLDQDGNGDISLDEMILTVTEIGRARKSVASSMHDVDQAIKVLDGLLSTVVFVVSVFVFVAFLNRSFTTTLATAGTALLSLSFVFAATCQEVLGSCIFIFVKHPYDIGDRIDLSNDQLTVEHISLLFTVFKRVNTGKMVQIPNIVLNNLWVENVSRSKAMREQISIFCNFETTIEDIEALRNEMTAFVTDAKNSRDFQPEIEIEVVGIAEMNKMELRIECKHKSNWANETIRAARRSKFMCALVLALRKVPIYGPGGGDAALGSLGQPTFSVSVSPENALKQRDEFSAKKEAKRLIPTKKAEERPETGATTGTDYSGNTANAELRAVQSLNTRQPGVDRGRDDAWSSRDDASASTLDERVGDRQSLEEVRGLLHRESTRGRRPQNASAVALTPIEEPQTPPVTALPPMTNTYAPPPANAYGPPPGATYSSPPGNAFAPQVQRRDVPPPGSAYGGGVPPSAVPKGPYFPG